MFSVRLNRDGTARFKKLFGSIFCSGNFMFGLANQPDNQKLLRAIIMLAHAFDTRLVAEGVDQFEILQFSGDCGCDITQGYWILVNPCVANNLSDGAKLQDALADCFTAYEAIVMRTITLHLFPIASSR